MTTPVIDAVKAALDAGIAILPPKQDGTKAPDVPSWTEYQKVPPSIEQVRDWYRGGRTGLGVLTGQVSGIEMLEFEGRAIEGGLLTKFLAMAEATGQGDLVARIEAGYTETTPSGGLHWIYRVETPLDNAKLARRQATADELAANPKDKIKVLIETRGEGGYVITAPSNGNVHPTGGRWTLTAGGFASIATITTAERDALFDLCRTFDRMPVQPPRSSAPAGSDRPGDRYNERPDIQTETLTLLERNGWTRVHSRDGADYLRRPGKDIGISASLGHVAPGVLYVFSTSTEFEALHAHDPFGIYARLEHGGDFRAAAAALEPAIHLHLSPTLVPSRPQVVEDHLRGMTAADLLALDIAPMRHALVGLLPEGLGVIGAPPKAGKSLLAYQMGVELALGGELFGLVAEQRHVRYYALEDGRRRSQSRIRALLMGRSAGLDRLELQWTAPRLGGPLEDEISAWLDQHPLGVVIVDVLSKVRASGKAGLNAYDEDYASISGLHTVARRHPGSVILLVTHDRKAGSEDWMTRITGTRGVTGAADFVIFISRKRTEMVGTIYVTGRDIEDLQYDVEFTGSGWRPAAIELLIGAASETRQTIFNWVKEHGPAWQKGIAEGTGLEPNTIYARVHDMVKDEQLVAGPDGYSVPTDG